MTSLTAFRAANADLPAQEHHLKRIFEVKHLVKEDHSCWRKGHAGMAVTNSLSARNVYWIHSQLASQVHCLAACSDQAGTPLLWYTYRQCLCRMQNLPHTSSSETSMRASRARLCPGSTTWSPASGWRTACRNRSACQRANMLQTPMSLPRRLRVRDWPFLMLALRALDASLMVTIAQDNSGSSLMSKVSIVVGSNVKSDIAGSADLADVWQHIWNQDTGGVPTVLCISLCRAAVSERQSGPSAQV